MNRWCALVTYLAWPRLVRRILATLTVGWSLAGGGDGMVGSARVSSAGAVLERDDLLSTKLTVPGVRPDRLARSRLSEALSEAMARELVLVCTPAGFGKTTLLADWSAGAKWPIAWCRWIQMITTRRVSGGMWWPRWIVSARDSEIGSVRC